MLQQKYDLFQTSGLYSLDRFMKQPTKCQVFPHLVVYYAKTTFQWQHPVHTLCHICCAFYIISIHVAFLCVCRRKRSIRTSHTLTHTQHTTTTTATLHPINIAPVFSNSHTHMGDLSLSLCEREAREHSKHTHSTPCTPCRPVCVSTST